ncbi:MAG: hypothetical protein Ct9H300mP11_21760 [Chloroflexota bacterium]|nr:MAG: hypothetical protein Ct9H300mP11_21760 [Chloroflexota bacterium]
MDIARDSGGTIDEANIRVSDSSQSDSGSDTGRQGSVGAWRNSFLNAPYVKNHQAGLGFVTETMETAVTWDRGANLDLTVRASLEDALDRVCGVEPSLVDLLTFILMGRHRISRLKVWAVWGAELEMYAEIKKAASDAIIAAGGTITHHHAVGRLHRPWYDEQRPELFARH